VLADAAAAAGTGAVAMGHEPAASPTPVRVTPVAAAFAADLAGSLASALTRAREAGEDHRQLSALASRIFRSWRTDEAERRLRNLAQEAYGRAMLDALASAGVERVVWITDGRGCPDCPGFEGARSIDEVRSGPFPPAHPDCGCALAPVSASS
jgi:hypothetical protein